jgi:hypothetical protein
MDQWLESVSQELGLRGQYLDAEGANQLAVKAAGLQARAETLFKSLTDIASDRGG